MNFHVMTLFPDMIMQGLSDSVIGRAVRKGTIGRYPQVHFDLSKFRSYKLLRSDL